MTNAYRLIPTTQYLSGNVRRKLDDARTGAAINPIFLPNVQQLEESQPTDVPLTDIDTTFSSIWIPLRFFEQFIREVLEIGVQVKYSEVNSAWVVTPIHESDRSLANNSTYGAEWISYSDHGNPCTRRLGGTELIELAMNYKTPAVSRRATRSGNYERDLTLTAGLIDKQRQLQERFDEWLRTDPERRAELEHLYNHKFNNIKLPTFDGSHLTLAGMSPKWRAKIRDYQLNGIYRAMLGNAGIFFEVGLGKTLTAYAICMERRRIDPRTKAIIVVKKSTLKQFGNGFRETYPHAKVLVSSPEDCEKGKRQLFMARIQTGNYDAVIMTQQQFEKLPLKPVTLKRHIEPLLAKVRSALRDHGIENDEDSNDRKKKKSYLVKNLERMRNRLKEQLARASKSKDKGLYFEDLGVNFVIADEADSYLNAPLLTKLENITGLSMTASGIASDFEWKCEFLRRTYGTGRLVLMTGTFIRNTIANLYVMMRLMMPEMLEERSIHCFDAWASLFGRVRTGAEIAPEGKISQKTRFSEFVNLPELFQMFFSVAEVKRYEDVKDDAFTRPTPRYINVLAPMSETQIEIMNSLVERAADIRAGEPQIMFNNAGEERVDNLLWVSTDGRKACLDGRLVRPWSEDFHKSKVNKCVRRVFKLWRKTEDARSTQMIFLDLSTPSANPSMYRDIREKLIRMGVPIEEIAFIQDYQSDKAKEKLFEDFNLGIVRILLGSTQMMGVGVNAQKKMIALHHLDCPWRPCDLEQREGRILRSGNENSKVLIYRYVTQGVSGNCGFDSFMWQMVEAKSRFIRQVSRGDLTMRRMEEDASEDPTFSAGQVKALATGDIRIMRHVEVEAELERLTRLKRSVEMDLDKLLRCPSASVYWNEQEVIRHQANLSERARDFELVRERCAQCSGENFAVKVLDVDYTERKAAGEALSQCARDLMADLSAHDQWRRIGFYGGFEILAQPESSDSIVVYLRGPSAKSYKVRFVLDKIEVTRRLEDAYASVLDFEAEAHRSIVWHQGEVDRKQVAIAANERQMGNVRAQIQEFSLEKDQLEVELGLKRDAMTEAQEIGESVETPDL